MTQLVKGFEERREMATVKVKGYFIIYLTIIIYIFYHIIILNCSHTFNIYKDISILPPHQYYSNTLSISVLSALPDSPQPWTSPVSTSDSW